MKLSQLTSSLSFAHLLGRDRPVGLSANIRVDDDSDDENDGAMRGRKSKAKGSRADDDTREDGEGNETDRKGKSARTESEEEEDEEEEDERPDGRKSKKAKAKARAEDSEREDEEDGDKEAKAMARGASRERARCKAIFACDGAGVRPDMAAHFAFNTSMSAEEAVSTLNAFAAGGASSARQSLSQRMEGVKTPNPGPADVPGPDTSTAKGVAASMVGLYNNVLGLGGTEQ